MSFRTVSDSLRDYFPIPDMNANIIHKKWYLRVRASSAVLKAMTSLIKQAFDWRLAQYFRRLAHHHHGRKQTGIVTRAAAESFTS